MTFSIAAFDKNSSRLGVAITTSSISVGSRCPWVRAGVGAVATQNITDPTLGNKILDQLEKGLSAQEALEKVLSAANYIEYRQLTVVDTQGGTAHFTGNHILGINAVAEGPSCIAAGNLLVDTSIPDKMTAAFLQQDGNMHLGEALLRALKAGLDAGGEVGDTHSAALLVAHQQAWPEIDLRVDWHDEDPVNALFKLWEAYQPQSQDYIMRAVNPEAAPSYGVPGDP